MKRLSSYLAGRWQEGGGRQVALFNPATEQTVAETSSDGLDLGAALAHARERGGPALRALTFAERGEALRRLAARIHERRDELIECGLVNAGNTRGDAKFDVDGAAAVLASYGELARTLPEGPWLPDGEPVALGRSSRLAGQHVWVPREGVAVFINAFNFPAWGMMEKAACAWLAGVPVLVKPATATALMAHRLAEITAEGGFLPEGAFSFLAGPVGDLLAHVDERDVVAFTGSSGTAASIRGLANVREKSVRVNVEADSLNVALLGEDAAPGGETFDLFLGDVARDATQKAGQKCTAIRRVLVPADRVEAVREALIGRLADVKIGDPAIEGVRMGPLASKSALGAVEDAVAKLARDARVAWQAEPAFERRAEFAGKGWFYAPRLLEVEPGAAGGAVHEVEAFGPVQTLVPYRDLDEALALVRRGGGGLVASIYTDDRDVLKRAVTGAAAFHGRLYLGSKKSAQGAPGPGTALPELLHGGPGRAGGGEELGGIRGLHLYMQRVAFQGYGPLVDWLMKSS